MRYCFCKSFVCLFYFSMLGESDSFEKDPVIKKAKQQSNFRALKNLIEADNSIRGAQNRIKVLQLIDQKNNHKLQNQVGFIEKIQQVRDNSNAHHKIIESSRQQMAQQAQQAHMKYQELNSQHRQKLKEVFEDIHKGRKWQYLTIQEQTQAAERQISESKKSLHEEKSRQKKKITTEEQMAKRSLIHFHEERQSRIKEVKVAEVSLIKAHEASKQKELRDLSNVEMQLIQKQSASQAAYLQVKQKLDSLLNNVKLQNNLSKKSLKPSVHLQGRENRMQS